MAVKNGVSLLKTVMARGCRVISSNFAIYIYSTKHYAVPIKINLSFNIMLAISSGARDDVWIEIIRVFLSVLHILTKCLC